MMQEVNADQYQPRTVFLTELWIIPCLNMYIVITVKTKTFLFAVNMLVPVAI